MRGGGGGGGGEGDVYKCPRSLTILDAFVS